MESRPVLKVLIAFSVHNKKEYTRLNRFIKKAKPYSPGIYTSMQEEQVWSRYKK